MEKDSLQVQQQQQQLLLSVTEDERNLTVSWLLDCFLDKKRYSLSVFLSAVHILDSFLGRCRINRTQLQISAVACAALASKRQRQQNVVDVDDLVRYLALASDGVVPLKDVGTWEMLVLSTLDWTLNHHDFEEEDEEGEEDFELVLALSSRDFSFGVRHPPRRRAKAAFQILRDDPRGEEQEEEEDVCRREMETLLLEYLDHSPVRGGGGGNQSPFKVDSSSTSTPKKKTKDETETETPRRKSGRRRKIFSDNKENEKNEADDSANITASTPPSSSSTSSTSSSKASSPDSGASITSSDERQLIRILTDTNIEERCN